MARVHTAVRLSILRQVLALLLLVLLLFPATALATTYGSGSYGDCEFEDGCAAVTTGSTPTTGTTITTTNTTPTNDDTGTTDTDTNSGSPETSTPITTDTTNTTEDNVSQIKKTSRFSWLWWPI
ncbi:MAG: hypothetical protein Q7T74_03000, partial [Candidatus Saccharibacteria bacterium]|nr:hypothetical protein [Candidatus Saccharibacteria bacterium]